MGNLLIRVLVVVFTVRLNRNFENRMWKMHVYFDRSRTDRRIERTFELRGRNSLKGFPSDVGLARSPRNVVSNRFVARAHIHTIHKCFGSESATRVHNRSA